MKLITMLSLAITLFSSIAFAGSEELMEITQIITAAFDQETGTFAENAKEILIEAHIRIGEVEQPTDQEKESLQTMNAMVTYNLACIETLNGNTEEAFGWLEESVASGYNDPNWMAQDGDLEGLKDDPRFEELLTAAGENYVEPAGHDCGSCEHSGTCH